MPGVGAQLGGDDRGPLHRRQRPRRAARAGPGSSSRSPAAITPPPITITSGSKMLAKLVRATPSREPIRSKTPTRGRVAGQRRLGHGLAVDLLAVGEQRAEGGVGLALGGRAALAAERRARGERLDAAAAGAVALAGRAVDLDHHVAELGAGAGGAAVDLAAEDQAAADPGADRQHHRVFGAARGAVEMLGEGGDVGVVVDEDRQAGALADEVADRQVVDRQVDRGDRDAAVVVDRRRDAEADRGDARAAPRGPRRSRGPAARPARPRSARSSASRLSQSTFESASRTPSSIFVPPRSTPIDFALHSSRVGQGWRRATAGIGMISAVFHGRRWRAAALRAARVQGLPVPEGPLVRVAVPRSLRPQRADSARAEVVAPRQGARSPSAPGRRGRWTAQAGAQMGRDRGARLDPAQLPRLRRLRPAAVLQALRRSEGRPARQPLLLPSAQTILVLGTDARPPDTKEPGAAPSRGVLRTAGPRRRPPRRLRSGPVPRRHADADPRRRRRLPQTLDPARQLRRNPRPEPAEDQRRLRLRRRRGCRSKRSKTSSASRSTTSRSSTSPASKT